MKYPVKTPFNPGMLVITDADGKYYDAQQVASELNKQASLLREYSESTKRSTECMNAATDSIGILRVQLAFANQRITELTNQNGEAL